MTFGRFPWPWAIALMFAGDPAFGADRPLVPRWSAHGFFAGGSSVGDNQAGFRGGGGGVNAHVWRGLTVGGDVSAYQDNYYKAVGTFGHAGTQVGYHFSRDEDGTLEPFVLFGVGAYFPEKSSAAVHGGGGLIYWFKPRLGFRLELRAGARPYGDNVDAIFRIGISFR